MLRLVLDRPSILSAVKEHRIISVGSGFGLIAAAVAAVATSIESIIALGIENVAVAFRLAAELQRLGRDIEVSDGNWACHVSDCTLSELNCQINEVNKLLRPLRRAYIGINMPTETVILGPPSTLDILAQRMNLSKDVIKPPVPYRCPMYGSHFPQIDVFHIVGKSATLEQNTVQTPIYSAHAPTSSTKDITLDELLRRIVAEIAHKPMRIEEVIDTVAKDLSESDETGAVLTVISSTWDTSLVYDVFEQHNQRIHVSDNVSYPKPLGSDMSSVPSGAIAIVGMSGRFPESDTLDELWQLLEKGSTTHQEIPPSRFCVNDFYDPSRNTHNALLACHGCFIKDPGDFDHRLFNISPREALQMDPVQRMLLMITYEALEMSGYAPKVSANSYSPAPPRIATYFGQTTDDWKSINEQQGIDTHFLPGVNRGFAPGRLCHYFQWAGGFYSIDTGCSSSATAMCLARDALVTNECDAAVVGGGTLLNAPEWFAGLSQGGFLSPSGACKTYSDKADGYCRGEGVAVVILKRLTDAIRTRDNILAVLAGAARNSNAGASSITYPSEQAQGSLYRRVLRQAGIQPSDVGVVEMHGTGTQAGDRIEMQAVKSVFASSTEPKRAQSLIVGAIKANIGHSEAAAGVVSMIKAILVLHHNKIPPQPCQPIALNPHLAPFIGADIQLANGQAWPYCEANPRYIFVNNFDAAGGNVSLVLRDPPFFPLPPLSPESDERAHHVVVTSGCTVKSYNANKNQLREFLIKNPSTQLASLAYTTTARRIHQAFREAYVVTSIEGLLHRLGESTPPSASNHSTKAPSSSLVFAFTGQGGQHVGMGGVLYRTSPTFRKLLDSYQCILDAQGYNCNFVDVINGTEGDNSTNATAIGRDLQVATVALEIALAHYWQSLGLRPTLLIGHSIGEYAALCIAGVLSVSDALALTYERASLIFAQCIPSESGMLAVTLPAETVRWRLRDSVSLAPCEVSCINSPSSTVVGGPNSAIDALQSSLESSGDVTTARLRVQHAFHTRQMDSVLDDLEASASRSPFYSPTIPIASTLLGRIVRSGEKGVFNAQYLRRHTREPVNYYGAVQACEAEEMIHDRSFIIEVGPHPTCIGLIIASLQKSNPNGFPSLRYGRGGWECISQTLAAAHCARLSVAWDEYHKDHLHNLRLVSGLPSYAFDKQNFWRPYQSQAAPYKKSTGTLHASFSGSTSLHSIEQIRHEKEQVIATFKANLSDQNLNTAIRGHVVDGVAICPASIFIDMAYAAAVILNNETHKASSTSLRTQELVGLSMRKPLTLRETNNPSHVLIKGILDQSTSIISVHFSSQLEDTSSTPVEHGACRIHLNQPNTACVQAWLRMQPLVKIRAHNLKASSAPKEIHAMGRGLFYKIFSEIVDYSAPYQIVEEATIAADFSDALVSLQTNPLKDLGTFATSPFLIDAIVHVAGFLLNADVRKPKNCIHIANHIESLRMLSDLPSHLQCRAYATIRDKDDTSGISLCDVYVTDDQEKLLVVCTGITFKKLERDFFALLTSSARVFPPKSRYKGNPRRDWQQANDFSSASATPTSETTSASVSSFSAAPDLSAELFDAISGRSGISLSELKSSTDMTFADMGVDSQMSISILADFRRATAVELPAAFFSNFPTPYDIKKALSSQASADDADYDDNYGQQTEKLATCSASKRTRKGQKPAALQPSRQLFRHVAEALGIEISDLTPSTTFESMGMDSMLSIKIISSFQQETQMELPASFFTMNQTVASAQKVLDMQTEPTICAIKQRSQSSIKKEHGPNAPIEDDISSNERLPKNKRATSRAVLIQGNSRSREAPLFLTTDGSGTVESYIHLKALPGGRRIYALESPFLGSPDAYDLSIEEMASIFIRTIRKIQPQGPYLIGGWSAGSIYAYEVAHWLTMQNETIACLVILDMRAPSLIPTSIVKPDFVDKLGTFEGINRARDLPEDLSVQEKGHLMATCRALSQYDAPAFPSGRQPGHIAVIWARLGLDDREDAPIAAMGRPGFDINKSLDEMTLDEFEQYFNSWFYGRRKQFGTNGWETLLGDHISVHCVDGGMRNETPSLIT